jgi:hypothetical protein
VGSADGKLVVGILSHSAPTEFHRGQPAATYQSSCFRGAEPKCLMIPEGCSALRDNTRGPASHAHVSPSPDGGDGRIVNRNFRQEHRFTPAGAVAFAALFTET